MRYALMILMLLAGCAGQTVVSRTGAEAAPPPGFEVYCQEHPSRVECGGNQ